MKNFAASEKRAFFILATSIALGVFLCVDSTVVASESHWAMGMAIGAGAGAAVGGGVGYALAPVCEENESKCRWQLPLLVGGTSMVAGGALGALIGSMFGDGLFGVSPLILPGPEGEMTFGLNVGGRFD